MAIKIFACVRAEEEKLKLMLQLDEVQLRLKSADFRKPVTKMNQHKSHEEILGGFIATSRDQN